jgi:hypothetical protein
MFNAYELDQDRRNFEALLKRQSWGRTKQAVIAKGRGGAILEGQEVDESMDRVMPSASKRAAKYVVDALMNKSLTGE